MSGNVQRRSSRPSTVRTSYVAEEEEQQQQDPSVDWDAAVAPPGHSWAEGSEEATDAQEAVRLLQARPDLWTASVAKYGHALRNRRAEQERAFGASQREEQEAFAKQITLSHGRLLDRALDEDQRQLEFENDAEHKARKREVAREGWRKRKASHPGKSKRRKRMSFHHHLSLPTLPSAGSLRLMMGTPTCVLLFS